MPFGIPPTPPWQIGKKSEKWGRISPKLDCSWAEFGSKVLRRGAVHLSESTLLTVDQPIFGAKIGSFSRPNVWYNLSKTIESSTYIWLERARADWPRALWPWSVKVHLARAGSSERPRDLESLRPLGPIRSSPLEPNGLWKNGFWRWQPRKMDRYGGPGGR